MTTTPDSVVTPDPALKVSEEAKEVSRIELRSLKTKLETAEKDLTDLKTLVSQKNDRLTKLEFENTRLKMQRTDKELGAQVDGLKAEVGKKDRENVELKKRIVALQDDQATILRRATAAEEKIKIMQTTMETFQKARDTAHLNVEKHDRERLEAVRQMIDASDRAKKAEARVAELEGKNKPKTEAKPKK